VLNVSTHPTFVGSSGRDGVVLVVDDVDRNLKSIGSILSDQRYEVLFAKSGREALDQIAIRLPDLVLLDLMMPGMDGLEVCQRLKTNPLTMDIPVIFLTAAHEMELAVKALEQGAVDFVTKPFHAPELLARVRTQVELKHTRDELHKIIAEKNDLMGAVAHDLKNPLGALRFSALMLRDPLPPATHRELVDGLIESCDGMLAFIQERLERSASESQAGKLKIEPIGLEEVLTRIVQQNLPAAHAKQSVIDLAVPKDAPATVLADYYGLCQVLDNLVSNALKFSPSGSRVTLQVEQPPGEQDLIVSVADEGPGLTDEDRTHLFEPYRRLSAKPTAGESSTGLGLTIARRLMERMGGTVGCDSTPGRGARFWIRIRTG
jgi:two-component system, sensor histidine kinase and response regulator